LRTLFSFILLIAEKLVLARHPQGPPSPGSAIPRVRYPQGPLSPGSVPRILCRAQLRLREDKKGLRDKVPLKLRAFVKFSIQFFSFLAGIYSFNCNYNPLRCAVVSSVRAPVPGRSIRLQMFFFPHPAVFFMYRQNRPSIVCILHEAFCVHFCRVTAVRIIFFFDFQRFDIKYYVVRLF
jgi:hypothetical protein